MVTVRGVVFATFHTYKYKLAKIGGGFILGGGIVYPKACENDGDWTVAYFSHGCLNH